MARRSSGRKKPIRDEAQENFNRGCDKLRNHPLFYPLSLRADFVRTSGNLCPAEGWAVVTSSGRVHVHPSRRADPEEWVYILAHCLLHLGLSHFPVRKPVREWNAACDAVVAA